MKKFSFITLGCDKNRVDSERILFQLNCAGLIFTDKYDEANIIFINTCAFIEDAVKETINTIFEINQYRQNNLEKLIVLGCFSNRFKNENLGFSEVDAFVSTNDYVNLIDILNKLYNEKIFNNIVGTQINKRILSTPPYLSFLKISEGCDNNCSFCTIPLIRGKQKSIDINILKKESEKLSETGVKELILIAQNVTAYGIDLYNKCALLDLLKELTQLNFYKIRLMYCYPEYINEELIHFISNSEKMANYLDIPFQHSEDRILKLMGRKSSHRSLQKLIDTIKKINSNIAIRATFMVGFPTETQIEFESLCKFVFENQFPQVALFKYSKEKNTAAFYMQGQIAQKIKIERFKKLAQIAYETKLKINETKIGKTFEVIYEGIDYTKQMFYGRSEHEAYEIDSLIYFKANYVEIGKIYNVKINTFKDYDLIGECV